MPGSPQTPKEAILWLRAHPGEISAEIVEALVSIAGDAEILVREDDAWMRLGAARLLRLQLNALVELCVSRARAAEGQAR